MRIGYILKRYPRISETFIVNEILGLEAAGVEVRIHALGFPAETRFHPTVAQVRGPVQYLSNGRDALGEAIQALRQARHLAAYPQVMAFLDMIDPRYRPDLLVSGVQLATAAETAKLDHLHAHFMTVAARTAYVAHLFSGIPFSVTAHAKDIFRHGVDRHVFGKVAGAAAAIITVSDFNLDFIHRELVPPGAARVVRVYNGLDVEALRPPQRSRDPHLLLAVGRLVEKKGFDRLLRVVASLPALAHLVIIGDGEERAALQQLAVDLGVGDRVDFLGVQPSDVVAEWMARARLLAAPFVIGHDGNQDALPTVLIEALARGLPAVAADVGGVAEIIDNDVTGLVVPTGDDDALAAGIRRLLTDDALHARMSDAGPARARDRFDRSVTTPQWLAAVQGSELAVAS